MIQQKAQIQLILNGDGTATTFAFDLGRAWGLYFPPGPGSLCWIEPCV